MNEQQINTAKQIIIEYQENNKLLNGLSDLPHGSTDCELYFTCSIYIRQNNKRIQFLNQQIEKWQNQQ